MSAHPLSRRGLLRRAAAGALGAVIAAPAIAQLAMTGGGKGVAGGGGGGTPFSRRFGLNTVDDHSMASRPTVPGTPTFAYAVETTGLGIDSGGALAGLIPDLAAASLGVVTLTTAELHLYCEAVYGGAGPYDVYQSLRLMVAGEISHNNYSAGNGWQTAGAAGALDRTARIGQETYAAASDTVIELDLGAMEDLVNGAVGTPQLLVYAPGGFVDTTGGSGTDGQRPYLLLEGTYL